MVYRGKHRGVVLSIALLGGLLTVPASAETVTRTAGGTWVVDGHGNGHGRGMSQYGARAAALAGVSAPRILAFYYPGTARAGIGDPLIRVLTNDAGDPFVQLRPVAGLRVGWAHHALSLPAFRGIRRWQVGPYGAGLRMRWSDGAHWRWYGPVLRSTISLTASHRMLRVYWNNGTATDYRTSLVVTRTGPVSRVVNRLRLDDYLRGVVPRESPSGWPKEALRAQAIAARTYAYARVLRPLSTLYDICATTYCQMYGGATNYRRDGSRSSGEERATNAAVAATPGVILTYRRKPAATEYSSSHGGQVAYGGAPYLPAHRDPYTAGDPYASWSRRVSSASVGRWFGFRRLDAIRVTARDGHGAYGGRVVAAVLTGITAAGRGRSVTVSGSSLKLALGVDSTYFRLRRG